MSISKRRVKRLTHDFQVRLSNEQYDEAMKMCTDKAVWQRHDDKQAHIRYMFEDFKTIKSKRAFYIVPVDGRDKEVSQTKIALICEMRQQTQEAIVDVGNWAWQSQIIWEKVGEGGRDWKIIKIRDISKRDFKRSQ